MADPGLGGLSRQLFALMHALVVTALTNATSGQRQFHAHFLGRSLDILGYAKVLGSRPEDTFTATAHAGDAMRPQSPTRLRDQLSWLDAVACASAAVEVAVKGLKSDTRTEVVHCGVPSEAIARPRERARGSADLHIMTVARLVEKKGIDDCIVAANLLASRGRSFEWTFIGDGPLAPSLRAQAEAHGLSDRTHWTGHLSGAEVARLLGEWADLFVLPCKVDSSGDTDGIPVALMEAMAVGVPVVTTPVGGISELVRANDTGMLVPPSNPAVLAQVAEQLMDDPEFRAALGQRGNLAVRTNFDAASEARKLQALLRRLAQSKQVQR